MVADPATLEPVPADGVTVGEIMMRGNVVMKGYKELQTLYNDQEEQKNRKSDVEDRASIIEHRTSNIEHRP